MRAAESDSVTIELDRYEHGVLLNTLNGERNRLIASGCMTDAVDEVLIKVAEAPQKKRRGRDEAR
jgi:hypothetical protein